MTRSELIHGLVSAGAPVVLFVGFIVMVAFVPIGVRRRLTPWLLAVVGLAVALFFIDSIRAGTLTDLAIPLACLGGALLTGAGQLKGRGPGYASAGLGALVLFAAAATFFGPAMERGQAPVISGLILIAAIAIPAMLAFFKIKEIRAARTANDHPMGTGTTA